MLYIIIIIQRLLRITQLIIFVSVVSWLVLIEIVTRELSVRKYARN